MCKLTDHFETLPKLKIAGSSEPATFTSSLRPLTLGICTFCKDSFNRHEMQEHLAKCSDLKSQLERNLQLARRDEAKPDSKTTIKMYSVQMLTAVIYDKYAPETYWLYLELPVVSSLVKLDTYLKQIWLECCGHLSAFEIDGKVYARYPDREYADADPNYKEYNMSAVKLGKLFEKSVGKFRYTYDYGSSTELELELISSWEGTILGKRPEIGLLARNQTPLILCQECKKTPATIVVTAFSQGSVSPDDDEDYYGRYWLCEKHARSNKYRDYRDYFMPVLNSPRTGQCGFDGTYTPLINFGLATTNATSKF